MLFSYGRNRLNLTNTTNKLDEKKNYENHLRLLSETKLSTDKFFDNVKVNDENQDLKNNRLELLQILCTTFNSFVDFSKLEGT